MLDNLRRTLIAPAAVLTLLVAWTLPGVAPDVWTKLVLLSLALPALVPVTTDVIPQRPGISKRVYLRSLVGSLALAGAHIALTLTLLAHQAWLMADAIVRTLYRLLISRRRLLEWVSAAQVKASSSLDLGKVYARMCGRGGDRRDRGHPRRLARQARLGRSRSRSSPSGSCRRRWPGG